MVLFLSLCNRGPSMGDISHASMCMCGVFVCNDGNFAADDCNVILWDFGAGRHLCTLRGHSNVIHSLAFSGEDSTLVSGSEDGTVCVWDVRAAVSGAGSADEASAVSPELLATYATKHTPVYNVAFSRRNLLLCAGVFDNDDSDGADASGAY